MSFQCLNLNDRLSLFRLGVEAILFSKLSRRLIGLDRSAAFLLLRLADGATVEGLTNELGLGPAEVTVAADLADLLAGREPPAEEYRTETYCSSFVPDSAATSPSYRMLNTRFSLTCTDTDLNNYLIHNLRHLLVTDRAEVDLAVSIEPAGSLWHISLNGTPQGRPISADRLLPLIYDRLRIIAYQHFPYLLAVHAAVVTDGHHTVVLPGISGSGKSTLTAALLAQGWQLLSDEVALLTLDGKIVPIPLGLCLKESSWGLLADEYPSLATLPIHIRFDGIRLRFLEDGAIRFALDGDSHRATHLCFPRFQPDVSCGVEQLSAVNALRRLTGAGYQVPGLTVESAGLIIDWIAGLTRFSMTYSSTEEALRLLTGILDGN